MELAASQLTRLQVAQLLFAGEHDEDGYELSAPTYSVWLAGEICRASQPATITDLRKLIYGRRKPDDIDNAALVALRDGFDDWWRHRGNRGL